MSKTPQRRFWRKCRIYFRRFRITVWLLLLLLIGSFIYLNQVGLPKMLKDALLQKLRTRGVDLQVSRVRLRWYQGIVADNVLFKRADEPLSPQLTSSEVKVSLQLRALARFKVQVDALTLRRGRLLWPIASTNGPARELSVEDIQTELRFLPEDQWEVDKFTASFRGAKIHLVGTVTNASAMREWKAFAARQPPAPGAVQERLRELAETLEKVQFSAPPELSLDLRGDGRDPQSFTIRLAVSAPGAETPWGTLSRGRFLARLLPSGGQKGLRGDISLEASGARTLLLSRAENQRPTAITNLQLVLHMVSSEDQTNLVNGELSLTAGSALSQWGSASNVQFSAQWVHSLTNPIPLSGTGRFRCDGGETTLGEGATARSIELNGQLVKATLPARSDPNWGWWTNLEPYELEWDCRLVHLHAPKIDSDLVVAGGRWKSPDLTVTNLHTELYQARIDATAGLNVADRSLRARVASDVDPHRLSAVLTEGARTWLAQYTWQKPPKVAADISLVLPAWTNTHPDWRAEVQPALQIAGDFNLEGGGTFRDLALDAARSHFIYSNLTWRLPDLYVTRPEGTISAVHQANDRTKEFYWKFDSSIDIRIIRPMLQTNQQRDLDLLVFSRPPLLSGEIRGRWHAPESIGFKGQIAATNFTIRGESMSSFQSSAEFTNHFLLLTNAHGLRGKQIVEATSLGIDFQTQKIYLAGGFSTTEPQAVARAIGPKVSQAIEPYRFVQPPTARVYGIIPIRKESDADLHFEVSGGPFQWSKFNLNRVNGKVHWKGERLTLEDVRADCYGGQAVGSATFDFTPDKGANYQFNFVATNTMLQLLMADLYAHTNNLEGALSGSLIVNKANSADWHSWQGGGNVNLRDGLVWDIPIFGIFSPVLNSISPGMGNSRANAATGTFNIVSGVVRSDDLEIRSPAMRLEYHGSVNFDGLINARVEAELLRDVWLLGPLVSTVFWPVTKLFEYRLTGSLNQPKTEPVWLIPKLVLMPFHPFRSLKELLPEETNPSRTNAPLIK